MSISYSEQAALTCPSCGRRFDAEVWMLVDAAERADLAHALREGTLNVVTCPHCGYHGPAGAALLFHDPGARRVYFAAPPGAEEHELREQAQSLLYLLVSNLPEEGRRAYLGDVQVEQEVEGVRRAVLRRQGARAARGGAAPDPAPPARGVEHHVVEAEPPAPPPMEPPIFVAIETLLSANNPEEFETIVDEHPALLSPAADAAFTQLVEAAYNQGDRDLAAALHEAHVTLAELRAGRGLAPEPRAPEDAPPAAEPAAAQQLSDSAYQALLRVVSAGELLEAARDHPALLEPWADAELAARAEAALDEGNERAARDIEERREALAELRDELASHARMRQAIQALLQAGDQDSLAQALTDHPILLTDVAQEALFIFAGDARVSGDHPLAERALECRALLREVRAGLEQE